MRIWDYNGSRNAFFFVYLIKYINCEDLLIIWNLMKQKNAKIRFKLFLTRQTVIELLPLDDEFHKCKIGIIIN